MTKQQLGGWVSSFLGEVEAKLKAPGGWKASGDGTDAQVSAREDMAVNSVSVPEVSPLGQVDEEFRRLVLRFGRR